jgi:hypothetical protein
MLLKISRTSLFQRLETNQRCVLKSKLKTKETMFTLVFGKHSIRAFSVFLEDSLRLNDSINQESLVIFLKTKIDTLFVMLSVSFCVIRKTSQSTLKRS